jgi:hypothetical protein
MHGDPPGRAAGWPLDLACVDAAADVEIERDGRLSALEVTAVADGETIAFWDLLRAMADGSKKVSLAGGWCTRCRQLG